MDYSYRLEWQTRCSFNAYCKRALRNELIDACRERKSRQKHEVNFSDLAPHEEKQLYTVDRYFVNEEEEAFCAGGLRITAKLLADATVSRLMVFTRETSMPDNSMLDGIRSMPSS